MKIRKQVFLVIAMALLSIVSILVIAFMIDMTKKNGDEIGSLITLWVLESVILFLYLLSPGIESLLSQHKILILGYHILVLLITAIIFVFFFEWIIVNQITVILSVTMAIQLIVSMFVFVHNLISNYYYEF